MKLSVMMPVYNERATIREIIRRVMEMPLDKELIIVDDFSTDGTREILREYIREGSSNIKVLFHTRNRGKGAAVRTALREVRGTFTIIQDADLEYDPKDYLLLLQPILKGGADVVYGSRFLVGNRNFLSLHWWANKILTTMANVLYRSHLSDMETCYKLFKTDILKSIRFEANRFDFEPEITARLLRKGVNIVEVPIKYKGRKSAEGKKITWRDGFSALRPLIKFRFFSPS
jgi:glycosyltransferase involved in cell wall biosynthesis